MICWDISTKIYWWLMYTDGWSNYSNLSWHIYIYIYNIPRINSRWWMLVIWMGDMNVGVSYQVSILIFPFSWSYSYGLSNHRIHCKFPDTFVFHQFFWVIYLTTIVWRVCIYIPSGKRLHSYGKSPGFMGKLTVSTAILNSANYQRVSWKVHSLRKSVGNISPKLWLMAYDSNR